MSKWHTKDITKGVYGELSKIQEELDEAFDAQEQGQDLMLLIELSDMIGAIEGVSQRYGMSIEQLLTFSRKRKHVLMAEIQEKNGEIQS